jgi:hypothetical protein
MLKTIFEEVLNVDVKVYSIKPDKVKNSTMEAINKLKFLKTDVEINGIKERFVLVYPSSYVKNSDMKIYPNLEKNEYFVTDFIHQLKNELDTIVPDNLGGYQVYQLYFDKYATKKWNQKLPVISKGPKSIIDDIKSALKNVLSNEDYQELLEILEDIKVKKSKNVIKLEGRVGSLDDLLAKYFDSRITFEKLCTEITYNNAKNVKKEDVEKYFKYIFSNPDVLEFFEKYR